nr:leishmanolysin-like peptidase isoform X2 [Tanacetum cinerariifolium]
MNEEHWQDEDLLLNPLFLVMDRNVSAYFYEVDNPLYIREVKHGSTRRNRVHVLHDLNPKPLILSGITLNTILDIRTQNLHNAPSSSMLHGLVSPKTEGSTFLPHHLNYNVEQEMKNRNVRIEEEVGSIISRRWRRKKHIGTQKLHGGSGRIWNEFQMAPSSPGSRTRSVTFRLCTFLDLMLMTLHILHMKKSGGVRLYFSTFLQVIKQVMDEKLGRTVTCLVLPRVVMHSRHHYGTYTQNFTGLELEVGGGRGTSDVVDLVTKVEALFSGLWLGSIMNDSYTVSEYPPKATEKEVMEYCRGKKPGYIVPKLVIFKEDLSKTSTGKFVLHEVAKSWDQTSMEEENVSLVDGVFEGAFRALALEMEDLVDAIEVYGG